MTKVYIHYTQNYSGGQPHGSDPYDSREPAYLTTDVKHLYLTKPEYLDNWDYYESVEAEEEVVVGDTAYLVYVTYTDGDTFGSTYGNTQFIGVYKDPSRAGEVATAIKESTQPKPMKGPGSKGSPKDKRMPELRYKPWEGYFARFEHVDIESFTIGP